MVESCQAGVCTLEEDGRCQGNKEIFIEVITMRMPYTNRRGDAYFLHQGTTKRGNPRYYLSKKKDGDVLDEVPDGYEVYENPNGRVSLRKTRPKLVTAEEISLIEAGVKKYADVDFFKLDVKEKTVTIFDCDHDIEELREMFGRGLLSSGNVDEFIHRSISYSASMRFVLVDEEKRVFLAERYCSLGEGDWLDLEAGDLHQLVPKYCKHLGRDSFYDLY